jgi:hypothetical protein
MSSYQLAIYNNPLIPQQAHRLAIIPNGDDPLKVKYVTQHGYVLTELVPIDAEQLSGVKLNELYVASSTLHEDEETIALMSDYPAHNDPEIAKRQMEDDQEFMAGHQDITAADRAASDIPDNST